MRWTRLERGILTAIDLLVDRRLLGASVHLLHRLSPQPLTLKPVAVPIHGLLQGVPFPPKHGVAVGAMARSIAVAPNARLRPVRWPVCLIIERCSVLYDLVEELGNLDGVRRGTNTAALKSAARVCNMAAMVGAVKVDAIPTPAHIRYQKLHATIPHLRREPDVRHDSGQT